MRNMMIGLALLAAFGSVAQARSGLEESNCTSGRSTMKAVFTVNDSQFISVFVHLLNFNGVGEQNGTLPFAGLDDETSTWTGEIEGRDFTLKSELNIIYVNGVKFECDIKPNT